MNAPLLSPSRRLRRTPFSQGVEAAGVKAYTVYNHMLLPTVFRSVEEDYRHLKEAVQVWDVACERQVELRGPDAGRLMQMLTPRDLRGMTPGQCFYVPIVDETGGMLNDPVAVKLSEDRWWISIADSDLLYWVKGIVQGWRLDVLVDEPDVSPLAIQGPRADDLMAAVFGDAVRDIRFFRFGHFDFQGRDMVIARSGYSKQGGFEIY
ncbi:MAG: dimethylsulfoniopropionate demethylase, partial [Roseovarius sp.]|uniref:dimethylsulfoniopropionate demethylase n=1 Tax=Roseovarius sp. TaxID=1486281 RepID=UPI001B64E735